MAARACEGHGTLVPRSLAVGHLDRLLVALAGEQDDVAGASGLERGLDRRASIGDELEVVAALAAGGLRAAGDLVEDGLAVLAARILVGDDHQPGTLAGDATHHGALGRVALPGRPEHDDEPAAARGGARAPAGPGRPAARPGCGRSRR